MSYTEEDIRVEAARQYKEILSDSGYTSVGERMDGESRWRGLDDDDWDKAANAVEDRLDKVADLSRWAVDMGANGLQPSGDGVTAKAGDVPRVQVHFAFAPDVNEEARFKVITSVGQYLSQIIT